MRSLFFFCLLSFAGWAQPCGPVVRALSAEFHLVQCNAYPLQVDDVVVLTRQGIEIGRAQVMRQEGSLCSIRMLEGQARRFDLVTLLSRQGGPQDRGPQLGHFVSAPPRAQPPTRPAPQAAPANGGYFHSMNFGGRVYQLNTGQVLTP